MRFVVLVFAAVLVLGCAVDAAPAYTLYYVDASHNVCRLGLDSSGHPTGGATKITKLGGYDYFSVSPDDRYILGTRVLSRFREPDTGADWMTVRIFFELPGPASTRHTLYRDRSVMEGPWVLWSPRADYYCLNQGCFDVDITIYSSKTRRSVLEHVASEPAVSSDGRFAACCLGAESVFLDLHTGRRAVVQECVCPAAWIGNTYRLAWADYGSIRLAEVCPTASGPRIRDLGSLREGEYYLVRYVPGRGLCFATGRDQDSKAYCSADLKTVHEIQTFPEVPDWRTARDRIRCYSGAWADQAVCSPDGRFVACPVDRGRNKMPEIRVFGTAGMSFAVAHGKAPQWKGNHVLQTQR